MGEEGEGGLELGVGADEDEGVAGGQAGVAAGGDVGAEAAGGEGDDGRAGALAQVDLAEGLAVDGGVAREGDGLGVDGEGREGDGFLGGEGGDVEGVLEDFV